MRILEDTLLTCTGLKAWHGIDGVEDHGMGVIAQVQLFDGHVVSRHSFRGLGPKQLERQSLQCLEASKPRSLEYSNAGRDLSA